MMAATPMNTKASPPLDNPMHRHVRTWGRLTAGCAIIGALAIGVAAPAPPRSASFITGLVVGVIFGTFALIAAIALIALRGSARRLDAILERMAAGEYLAYFNEFRSDEIRDYVEAERRSTRRKAAWAIPLFSILTFGGVAGGVVAAMIEDQGFGLNAVIVIAAALLMIVVCSIVTRRLMLGSKEAFFARILASGAQIYVGYDAVWFSGWVPFLRQTFSRLTGARFGPGPPAKLELEIRVSSGTSASYNKLHLPIPAGREADAARAAEALAKTV